MRSCPRASALPRTAAHAVAFATLTCISSALGAQEPAAAPRRSLADGMLRQLVEVEGVTLPRFESGLEPGSGEGPLVLLRLSAEGEPRLQELPRGYGDHGEGVEPVPMDEEIEEEEVAAGAPQPEPAGRPGRVTLRVERIEGEGEGAIWRLNAGAGEGRQHAWPAAQRGERAELAAFLRGLREAAAAEAEGAGEGAQPVIELALPADASATAALRLWDAARAAGFGGPLLSGRVGAAGAEDPAVKRIGALAEEFGWEVRRVGRQPICTGELLVMLEGDVSWGRVVDVYAACARAGIWDIAFVGTDGPGRCKLPLPVPFDKGLLEKARRK